LKNLLTSSFSFALLAAVGNAIFVLASRKVAPSSSPFLFIILSLIVTLISLFLLSLFFPKTDLLRFASENGKWIAFSGIGLAITYIGFYYLYSRFGATYYILYAILSFITTSIIVGIILLKENFNLYFVFSILSILASLYLFYLGKQHS
jgi:drug/metabolite transporter (DMT)-like permease